MNYYRRYVGDYLRDTARLSLLEHGAYTLMLDYVYSDERPLPLDHTEICRMVRAIEPAERDAVDRILAMFFVRTKDGYRNARADTEIEKAAPLIAAAKENGRKGGRPRNSTDNPAGYSHRYPTGIPAGVPNGLHPPSSNHQPPNTSLQEPSSKKRRVKTTSGTLRVPGRANGSVPAWEAYSAAYALRYAIDPVRNAKVNACMKNFVARIGEGEAPALAAFYLSHNLPLYVRSMHDTTLMLRDAEKLRTEWATGRRMTTLESTSAETGDTMREQSRRVGKLLGEE